MIKKKVWKTIQTCHFIQLLVNTFQMVLKTRLDQDHTQFWQQQKKQRGLELYKAQHNTPVQLRVLLFFLRDWRLKLFYAVSLSLSLSLNSSFSLFFLFVLTNETQYVRAYLGALCSLFWCRQRSRGLPLAGTHALDPPPGGHCPIAWPLFLSPIQLRTLQLRLPRQQRV